MEVIRKNPLYFGVYEIVLLAGVGISIFLTLLLPVFILEKQGFLEAAGRSTRFIQKHFFQYTWMMICFNSRIVFRISLAMIPLFFLSGVAAVLIGRDSRNLLLAIGTTQ